MATTAQSASASGGSLKSLAIATFPTDGAGPALEIYGRSRPHPVVTSEAVPLNRNPSSVRPVRAAAESPHARNMLLRFETRGIAAGDNDGVEAITSRAGALCSEPHVVRINDLPIS